MSDETGRVTDEELARIGWEALGIEVIDSRSAQSFLAIARALRAALIPSVTPLAPGEVVTIPDSVLNPETTDDTLSSDAATLMAWLSGHGTLYVAGMTDLDAAGIAALETVCRRARAALEGGA